MIKDLFKKSLIFGIMLLFVGMSFIPVNASLLNAEEQATYLLDDEECDNSLGNMTAFLTNRFQVIPITILEPCKDCVYSFPSNDGSITANFSFNSIIWSTPRVLFPHLITFEVRIHEGPNIWDAPLPNGYKQHPEWIRGITPKRTHTTCLTDIPINMENDNKTLCVELFIWSKWFYFIDYLVDHEAFTIEVRAI